MATSFEEIYCLNAVIKSDERLVGQPSYKLYDLYWKYLQLAIPYFQYDCRKNLLDLVPFSLTEYSFTGDGMNNIFKLEPAPEMGENPLFYISTQIDCGQPSVEVTDYQWDNINNTITFTNYTPAIGEIINITVYQIGYFNADLNYDEKAILARAMNIPYYEEQMTSSKILNFAVYGGSIKMHSQAEQIKTVTALYQGYKREVEGDISMYSYRTAPKGLKGLGARTVCLHPLRYQPKPTVSD
jgi:hypothetical protein